MKTAKRFVEIANTFNGRKESDGTHKEIVDIYNSYKPHPRGYKLKYTDGWCAGFVSAVAIKGGFTDIIPPEVSCDYMIKQFKKLGVFVENENRIPNVGDIVFYDWQDNGVGDNMGYSDHVGIVVNVSRETFTVKEGNYSNAVKDRVLKINGKYIRGFAVPKYDAEVADVSKPSEEVSKPSETVTKTTKVEIPVLRKGSKGYNVTVLQTLLVLNGHDVGKYGVDASFGGDTEKAVKAYQEAHELEVDGVVGFNTWTSLLKG